MNRSTISQSDLIGLTQGIRFVFQLAKGVKYLAFEKGKFIIWTNWCSYERKTENRKNAVDYYNNAERHFKEDNR